MVVFRELWSYLRNIINNIEPQFRLIQFLNVPGYSFFISNAVNVPWKMEVIIFVDALKVVTVI
jgi:hypothetical protein